MNRLLILPVLLLTLLVGTPAFSADWNKGAAAYESGDYATALREWTPLAEQGNASMQNLVGTMHNEGKGTPQDYKTAVKWWRLAAEQGNAHAQFNLGTMHNEGRRSTGL
jgi:TPR repeat protein